MEIRNFITLKTIAETGSFTAASRKLGYAQSTITTHINQMEEHYGSPLFDRLGKKVILTEFGHTMLKKSEKLLALYDDILKTAASDSPLRGIIRIGAEETVALYRLGSILEEFYSRYPEVEITLLNAPYTELRDRLKEGSLDIIFIMDKKIDNDEFDSFILTKDEMVFASAPSYRKKRSTRELSKPRIIQTRKGSTLRYLFDKYLSEKKIEFDIAMETTSLELVKQSIIYGNGVAILPKVAIMKEINDGKLDSDTVDLDEENQLYTQMVIHKSKFITGTIQLMVDIVKENYQ